MELRRTLILAITNYRVFHGQAQSDNVTPLAAFTAISLPRNGAATIWSATVAGHSARHQRNRRICPRPVDGHGLRLMRVVGRWAISNLPPFVEAIRQIPQRARPDGRLFTTLVPYIAAAGELNQASTAQRQELTALGVQPTTCSAAEHPLPEANAPRS
jgi:hypothetical protein